MICRTGASCQAAGYLSSAHQRLGAPASRAVSDCGSLAAPSAERRPPRAASEQQRSEARERGRPGSRSSAFWPRAGDHGDHAFYQAHFRLDHAANAGCVNARGEDHRLTAWETDGFGSGPWNALAAISIDRRRGAARRCSWRCQNLSFSCLAGPIGAHFGTTSLDEAYPSAFVVRGGETAWQWTSRTNFSSILQPCFGKGTLRDDASA